jgi:hypothetical protein
MRPTALTAIHQYSEHEVYLGRAIAGFYDQKDVPTAPLPTGWLRLDFERVTGEAQWFGTRSCYFLVCLVGQSIEALPTAGP